MQQDPPEVSPRTCREDSEADGAGLRRSRHDPRHHRTVRAVPTEGTDHGRPALDGLSSETERILWPFGPDDPHRTEVLLDLRHDPGPVTTDPTAGRRRIRHDHNGCGVPGHRASKGQP